MPSWARTVGTACAVGLLSLLSAASALDRAALDRPAWLRLALPLPIGPSEPRNAAMRAVNAHDYPAAMTAAAETIRRAPLSPRSTSLLGTAEIAAGQLDAAERSFRAAAGLGWRDALTQIYWLEWAVDQNLADIAAERLDAISRLGADSPASLVAEQTLESSDDGRRAIAARLRANPDWRVGYALALNNLPRQARADRIAVLFAARRLGLGLDDLTVGRVAYTLIARDDVPNALAFWTLFKGPGDLPSRGIWDAGLKTLNTGEIVSPYYWTPAGDGQARVEYGAAPFAEAVHIDNDSAVRDDIARTHLTLPAGRVRITWKTDDHGERQPAIRLRVECDQGGAIEHHDLPSAGLQSGQEIEIAPSRCSSQNLTLYTDGELGADRVKGWFGDLALTRLR